MYMRTRLPYDHVFTVSRLIRSCCPMSNRKDISDIKLQLYLRLRLLLKFFDLNCIELRQVFQRFYTETPEKLFCRAEQQRPSGCIQPPYFRDQIIFQKLIDRMVAAYASYLLDLKPGNRLLVSDNGKCFQKSVRQHKFLVPWRS